MNARRNRKEGEGEIESNRYRGKTEGRSTSVDAVKGSSERSKDKVNRLSMIEMCPDK